MYMYIEGTKDAVDSATESLKDLIEGVKQRSIPITKALECKWLRDPHLSRAQLSGIETSTRCVIQVAEGAPVSPLPSPEHPEHPEHPEEASTGVRARGHSNEFVYLPADATERGRIPAFARVAAPPLKKGPLLEHKLGSLLLKVFVFFSLCVRPYHSTCISMPYAI